VNRALIDRAADDLRATSRAFSRKNLYHAAARRLRAAPPTFAEFCNGPLARRLGAGPVAGLLPPPNPRRSRPLPPREWSAYFPAAILMVDRAEIVDIFAASGALVQARVAPVCIDGTPRHVVRWLCDGLRAGHRAPVGFLHDAATVVYPYLFEPLATLVALSRGAPLPYRDLGLPPGGGLRDPLGLARPYERRVRELEELPPASLVAYAASGLLSALPHDAWLAPIRDPRRSP
jgi:hypothetical protein